MKRYFILSACTALVLSSCGTYEGQGAYMGSGIGAILGSSIGDLAGGWNGSDIGTVVGMAGGAVIGGAIGAQQDRQRQSGNDQIRSNDRNNRWNGDNGAQGNRNDVYGYGNGRDDSSSSSYGNGQGDDGYQYGNSDNQKAVPYNNRNQSSSDYSQEGSQESGFDPSNSGDDRVYGVDGNGVQGGQSNAPETISPSSTSEASRMNGYVYNPQLEIRNARLTDSNRDNILGPNEVCRITFEIYNTSSRTMTDIVPVVVEANKNRHIYISPSIHVEKIDPGRGIRYSAVVKADGRLRDGSARFYVSAIQGNRTISKVSEFNIQTRSD